MEEKDGVSVRARVLHAQTQMAQVSLEFCYYCHANVINALRIISLRANSYKSYLRSSRHLGDSAD